MASEKALLKPREAAQHLGLGRDVTYRLLRSGAIQTIRIGKRIYVRLAALDRWLLTQERRRG